MISLEYLTLESLAVTSIRSHHPMASDRSQKRNLEKETRISYSSAKGYCAVCPFVAVGEKENVEPSWKNQKADAPVIELGKGNRNLVMGVTGTHTPINLGCEKLLAALHRCLGQEIQVLERLHNLRPRIRAQVGCRIPSPGFGDSSPVSPPAAWPTPEPTQHSSRPVLLP